MDLYVSDLDGTLLNSNQEISRKSAEIINSLLEKGLNFTIATARSYISSRSIISPLNLKLPVIVHNGVFVYDPARNKNILSNVMEEGCIEQIICDCEGIGGRPIVFSLDKEESYSIHYKGIFSKGEEHYIGGRLASGDKRFKLVENYTHCFGRKIITVIFIGEKVEIEPLYNMLKSKYDLCFNYSVDIYSKAYWLEVTHKDANKRSAVKFLKSYLKAEKLICFGDNLNDLPMFQEADEKYAVSNAVDEIKKLATGIIGSNEEDGVAEFLQERFLGKYENIKIWGCRGNPGQNCLILTRIPPQVSPLLPR